MIQRVAEPFWQMLQEQVPWLPMGVDLYEDRLPPYAEKCMREAIQKNFTEDRIAHLRKTWGID